MGILFAVIALLSWGIGDFLIQKTTRSFGNWIALFYICLLGSVALIPFIYKDLGPILFSKEGILFMVIASVALLTAAILEFEALRQGKISVIEPILALEVFVTTALSTIIVKEVLSFQQIISIGFLVFGVILVSVKSLHLLKKIKLEKGVAYAVVATFAIATANVLFGIGSRTFTPLMINWFTSTFLMFASLLFLTIRGKLPEIARAWKANSFLIFTVSLFDNIAWISFAQSTTHIPISIATSISECYVVIASFLGISMNRERMKLHQWLGFIITVSAAIYLAYITS